MQFKEENPQENNTTELLKYLATISKSKHQTDFLSSTDKLFEGLVSLKLILTHDVKRFPFLFTLFAKVTRLSFNS